MQEILEFLLLLHLCQPLQSMLDELGEESLGAELAAPSEDVEGRVVALPHAVYYPCCCL